ncbi:MAG: PAS domain S-box protein, partial [Proteobacteria bacterium]
LVRYAPAGVIINGNFQILQFRGRTAPFLEPPLGQPSHELLKMAHPGIVNSLKTAVLTAKKQNSSVRTEQLSFRYAGQLRTVNLEVIPVNPLAPKQDREFLVLFENQTDSGVKARITKKSASRLKTTQAKANAKASASELKPYTVVEREELERRDQMILQLQQELDASREYQQSLIEQFESSQEELTSSNEELQSTNEELQSTNEELGTAKEELQSSNEELSSTNDELQKRNQELFDAIENLEKTEQRFGLIIDSVQDYAIIMLDPSGRISSWNAGAKRLKGYESEEIVGQHFSKFYSEDLVRTAYPEMELRVASQTGRFEDEGWRLKKDGSKFWANVIISAIRDHRGKLLGFSKVTRDLTERKNHDDQLREINAGLEKRVEERTLELRESEEHLRAFADTLPQLAWMGDSDGKVFWFNRRWE